MKAFRLFYGFIGSIVVLTVCESTCAGDDGYVQIDQNGNAIVPALRVRKRKMPRVPKLNAVADPGQGFDNPVLPIKPPTKKILKESDESRTARREQKSKDAELESKITDRLRQLNNLRHKNGMQTMSGQGCTNGICAFSFKEESKKVSCTGSVESFLIDESPGFTCGGSVCSLSAKTGKMDCENQDQAVVANPVVESLPGNVVSPHQVCRMVNGAQICEVTPDGPEGDIRRERRPSGVLQAI